MHKYFFPQPFPLESTLPRSAIRRPSSQPTPSAASSVTASNRGRTTSSQARGQRQQQQSQSQSQQRFAYRFPVLCDPAGHGRSDAPPRYGFLEENPWVFSRAEPWKLQAAAALGVVNWLGVRWLSAHADAIGAATSDATRCGVAQSSLRATSGVGGGVGGDVSGGVGGGVGGSSGGRPQSSSVARRIALKCG